KEELEKLVQELESLKAANDLKLAEERSAWELKLSDFQESSKNELESLKANLLGTYETEKDALKSEIAALEDKIKSTAEEAASKSQDEVEALKKTLEALDSELLTKQELLTKSEELLAAETKKVADLEGKHEAELDA